MIEIRDLRVDFDNTRALDGVSIKVESGTILGLVGPNGAGKTTLFRSVLGLIDPSSGVVLIDGIDVATNPDDCRKRVGLMPDFSPLYEQLTVYDFLDIFASAYLIPREKRRPIIEANLELVGLTDKRKSALKGLSRGMRQRLMLAKTLLPDPTVLLLDEPASGLDPQGRILLKDVLLKLKASNRAIIISSHILAEMSEFCTEIAVLEKGRIVVQGRIDEVADKLLGKAEIEIRYLEFGTAAHAVIQQFAGCSIAKSSEGSVSLQFNGGDVEAAALLSNLVASGARITSFARTTVGIEEIYRKIAPKELS